MITLERTAQLWSLDLTRPSPIEVPNVGRQSLMRLYHKLGFKTGVEVGTERGIFAKLICELIPGVKLSCVDPWLAYRGYREHVSQKKLDAFYAETARRMAPYNCELIRKTSVEAARQFRNNSLDFVYLDGNHALPWVIEDLHAWLPKIRTGGCMSGHDFIRRNNSLRYQCHVVEAVHAYTQSYMIKPWFVIGRKRDSLDRRDAIRSFMWVKA